ncbi:MAG: deoxynucleoside kinase [candidate division Zixibacteria bacterium]|nr:deoxynucleoside kinase [candidate division Zixibacteria bacterium]
MPHPDHHLIAVEGLPGSGHSEFAAWIGGQPDWYAELEGTTDHLPDIERSPLSYVLQRLIGRYERHQSLVGADLFRHRVVTDYTFATHALWAQCILSDHEWSLYQKIAVAVVPPTVRPDLVVYFQAPERQVAGVLRQRHKGVEFERWLELCRAYQRHFFAYEDSPLLVVRTDGAQWFDGIGPREALWKRILTYPGGKTYFVGESGLWDGGTPADDRG